MSFSYDRYKDIEKNKKSRKKSNEIKEKNRRTEKPEEDLYSNLSKKYSTTILKNELKEVEKIQDRLFRKNEKLKTECKTSSGQLGVYR